MSGSGGAPLRALLEALQRRAVWGMLLDLTRVRRALGALGDPQRALACVHIAGSNGKGSTAAMVEAVARAAGLRTGLYTSPHLMRFAERIRIDGDPIGDEAFARSLARALGLDGSGVDTDLTFFECLTVAAFDAFREAGVDVTVLEVGLGGRLDATNAIEAPLVTAVTSIALEHTAVLGDTIAKIAAEKAGIFKRGAPVVLGALEPEAQQVMEEVAEAAGAGPQWRVERGGAAEAGVIGVSEEGDGSAVIVAPPERGGRVRAQLGLRGPHQAENAAVAAGIAWRLSERWPALEARMAAGLAGARWPGRFERIERGGVEVILDCAHNPHGAEALARALSAEGVMPSRTALVFGALADKSWQAMLGVLSPLARARYYATPKGRAAAALDELCAAAPGTAVGDPKEALARALGDARPGDTVVVTGSIYLVGEVRAALLGVESDPVIAL